MAIDHMDYAAFVAGLSKSNDAILQSINDSTDKAHLLHASIGVAGEAGELCDAIKKYAIYNQDIDIDNIVEELGDLYFYMQQIMNTFSIPHDLLVQANMNKLQRRYKDGYSDRAAKAREDKADAQ